MSEGTATDLPISIEEISKEEVDQFSLDPHLVNLLLHEPFFSHILRRVGKTRTDSIPTAGVYIRDSHFYMLWNPKFVAALKAIKIRGLMKHECYHLIFGHCSNRKQDPHMLWNWATDLAINSVVPEAELPEGGLIPGKPLDLSKIQDPASLEKWKKVSDLIESLPKGMASEWYMSKLQQDKDVGDTIGGSGPGEGEGGPGGEPGPGDDHGGWGDLTDEERQIAEEKIKQSVREAVKKCDRTGQWGSVSGEMRGRLRRIADNSVNWKSVLYNFCGRSQRMNKSRTLKKLNRKYPYIHSGVRRSHSANLAIYIDQSGSVSDDDVSLFFGALDQLGRLTNFTVFPFDTSVDEDNALKWRKGQKVPPQRSRCGGTSFHAVAEHFSKKGQGFDGYVVLTDGEASDPGVSRKRRCWVLLPDSKLYFSPHPGDIVVKMSR